MLPPTISSIYYLSIISMALSMRFLLLSLPAAQLNFTTLSIQLLSSGV